MRAASEFWECAVVGEADSCWLWQRGKTAGGYGQVQWDGRVEYAHRVAFALHFGHWPTGVLRHECDTPACINPRHVLDGTQRENMQDKLAKGRANMPRGESHGHSKLTEADVVAIRLRYAEGGRSHRQLAPVFGVSHRTIGDVVNRKIWSHV